MYTIPLMSMSNIFQNKSKDTFTPSPNRVFEKFNYYWSRRYHVENNHTSTVCCVPNPGHQPMATKTKTKGKPNNGVYKPIMRSHRGAQQNIRGQKRQTKPYLHSGRPLDSHPVCLSCLPSKPRQYTMPTRRWRHG